MSVTLLEGVDPQIYANFQKLNLRDSTPPKDGNVRMEFTPSDLMGIRQQALETVAAQMENEFGVHPRPSADEARTSSPSTTGASSIDRTTPSSRRTRRWSGCWRTCAPPTR
jgi:hypothetical protein